MDKQKYKETLRKMDLKTLTREKNLINNNVYMLRDEVRERTALILKVMQEKANIKGNRYNKLAS